MTQISWSTNMHIIKKMSLTKLLHLILAATQNIKNNVLQIAWMGTGLNKFFYFLAEFFLAHHFL